MADVSNRVIAYLGDMTDIENKLRNLAQLNTLLAAQFGNQFTAATQIISTNVDKINQKVVNVNGTPTLQTFGQVSAVFKDAEGKLKTFSQQVQLTNNGIVPLNNTLRDGGKVTRNFGDEVKSLAGRAFLTIPIWLALRAAIMGVFQGISGGFSNLVAFDLALQKIKRNLQGTPEEIAANFRILRDEITKTSLETGVSTEKIAEAVKKFATIGFSAKDALAGGIESTKLSVVLFGDAAETAETYARSLKVLMDNSKGAASFQTQMGEAFALTAELEKTNQFELNEVNAALIKFAPSAKAAGLSLRETLVLLATLGTAGRTGASAGTLLSSSVNKLRINLDKLSSSLGIRVNPKLDTTFSIITKVLDKAEELAKVDKLGAAQTEAIADVFGGERGTKTIASLISLNKQFKENSLILPDVIGFNKAVGDQLDTVAKRVDILQNRLKESGKSFVVALTGSNDFKDSVKKLGDGVEASTPTIQNFGDLLRNTFVNIPGWIAAAIVSIAAFTGGLGIGVAALVALLALIGTGFSGTLADVMVRGIKDADKKSQSAFEDVIKGLQGKLNKTELNSLVLKIKQGKIKLADGTETRVLQVLEERLAGKTFKPAITVKPELKIETPEIKVISQENITKLAELVLKDQLEQLKVQGANNVQLLQAEIFSRRKLDIEGDTLDIFERQLSLQRAINNERKLTNDLSSNSMKLFEIAQTSGIAIAQKIGDVLAGNIDFDLFIRQGGEAADVFAEKFATEFKQQQAKEFFQGTFTPGFQTAKGGTQIPIAEEAIRLAQQPLLLSQPTIAKTRAIESFIKIELNVQTRHDLDEVGKKVTDKVTEALKNPEHPLTKQLAETTGFGSGGGGF